MRCWPIRVFRNENIFQYDVFICSLLLRTVLKMNFPLRVQHWSALIRAGTLRNRRPTRLTLFPGFEDALCWNSWWVFLANCVCCFPSVIYLFIPIFVFDYLQFSFAHQNCFPASVWMSEGNSVHTCNDVIFHLTSWITNLMKIYFSIQKPSGRIMNYAEVLWRNKLTPFSWRLCAKWGKTQNRNCWNKAGKAALQCFT